MNCQKAILDKKNTSRKIKSLILNSNYTIEAIANMLELASPRVIYYWINGKKLPSIESLYNLSLIFNIKMEDCLIFIR